MLQKPQQAAKPVEALQLEVVHRGGVELLPERQLQAAGARPGRDAQVLEGHPRLLVLVEVLEAPRRHGIQVEMVPARLDQRGRGRAGFHQGCLQFLPEHRQALRLCDLVRQCLGQHPPHLGHQGADAGEVAGRHLETHGSACGPDGIPMEERAVGLAPPRLRPQDRAGFNMISSHDVDGGTRLVEEDPVVPGGHAVVIVPGLPVEGDVVGDKSGPHPGGHEEGGLHRNEIHREVAELDRGLGGVEGSVPQPDQPAIHVLEEFVELIHILDPGHLPQGGRRSRFRDAIKIENAHLCAILLEVVPESGERPSNIQDLVGWQGKGRGRVFILSTTGNGSWCDSGGEENRFPVGGGVRARRRVLAPAWDPRLVGPQARRPVGRGLARWHWAPVMVPGTRTRARSVRAWGVPGGAGAKGRRTADRGSGRSPRPRRGGRRCRYRRGWGWFGSAASPGRR